MGVTRRLLERCHIVDLDPTPYEKIFGLAELGAIRLQLSRPVLARIVEELGKALQLEEVDSKAGQVMIRDHREHYLVTLEEGKWICHCFYSEKTNLPCRHMLKVIVCRRNRILDYVHPRWLTHNNFLVPKSKPPSKKGRERSSGRTLIF